MKLCTDCQQNKEETEFNKNVRYCRPCAKVRTNRSRHKAIYQFNEWKQQQPCADCQRHFPYYVLDLDHRPGEVKVAIVSDLIRRGKVKAAHAELAKCDVVCSNCHRERSFRRRETPYQAPVVFSN